MLKISDAVADIVSSSEFAIEGLANGCLNISAYAKQILPLVKERTKKPVQQGAVIAALNRYAKMQEKHTPFAPKIEAHNLVSRSGLAEITYIKTPGNQQLVSQLYNDTKFTGAQFFVVTVGVGEISIITTEDLAEEIKKHFAPQQPTLFLKGLASLSMQTPESGIETPNQFYTITKQFAVRRINIVEFVTTFTELSFILDEKDLKQAFNALHDAFFSN